VEKHGKKYQETSKLVDKSRTYSAEEAIELAKKASYVKFDETVELHLRWESILGVLINKYVV